ncbi:MAG: hypothetical protein QOG59_3606, partial [Solirubrobacteraceae bacterium]|nr:hypothetical protein [Solirubrobacteraceae bacterium]
MGEKAIKLIAFSPPQEWRAPCVPRRPSPNPPPPESSAA